MSTLNALSVLFITPLLSCMAGAAIGATLGTMAPDYYRSIFPGGHSGNLNPLHLGLGLGATQGISVGLFIGLMVVGVQTWRSFPNRQALNLDGRAASFHMAGSWKVHLLWGIAAGLSILAFSAVSLLVGGILGQQQLYQTWADRKLQRLQEVLASRDYESLEPNVSSAAHVSLVGTLQNTSARDLLHTKLVLLFGTQEAEFMIRPIDIAKRESADE